MQYTVLSLEEIQAFTRQYPIEDILSFKVLEGGSQNTNYLLSTQSDQYVLTICEKKSDLETVNLAKLLMLLGTNGFVTSRVIITKEMELITHYAGKPVLLKSFLKGTIIDDLPANLLELIGGKMGRLHQINAPDYLPKELDYGVENFHEIALYDADSEFDHWLRAVKQEIEPYLAQGLPKTLIHSDIFTSNVIIGEDEKEVAIMDFEEATDYYRIFDIGMAFVGLCRENGTLNLEKVNPILKGYLQVIDLTSLERKALQTFTMYAAAAMSFWRHKNFNYTNPTPDMTDHYLELKSVADFVSELPENRFEQILDQLD